MYFKTVLSEIFQKNVYIHYFPGKENQVADIMSTPMGNLNSLSLGANILKEKIIKAQENCEELKHILNSYSALKLVKIPQDLYCNIIEGTVGLFFPHLRQIFNSVHNMSHLGVLRSQKLIREMFVWPNNKKEIKNWSQ